MNDRLIYALEAPDLESERNWVEKLKRVVSVFKIGKQLFTKEGPAAVSLIHESGARTFLDLKYHDIPSTVSQACYEAARLGVFMMNVHASGGRAMMEAAKEGALRAAKEKGIEAPKILAVTVLTSLSDKDIAETGLHGSVEDQVIRLARLAKESGLDGVVASPREIQAVRRETGEGFIIVTPGVRPSGVQAGDQKRIMTPGDAIKSGADYLVVGRPIREASDPEAAAKAIIREMEAASQA